MDGAFHTMGLLDAGRKSNSSSWIAAAAVDAAAAAAS